MASSVRAFRCLLPRRLGIAIVFMVLLAPSFGEESFAKKMRSINEDLEREITEFMPSEPVNYSTINTTGTPYAASTKFNPKGMGQLYNVTNMFIDLIQSKQAYPEGEYDKGLTFLTFLVHTYVCFSYSSLSYRIRPHPRAELRWPDFVGKQKLNCQIIKI